MLRSRTRARTRHGNKKEVVQHFYHKDLSVPIWAIFEILTLGEFGNCFSCLNYPIRNAVSKSLGLHQAFDTDAFLTKRIIFAIKDLRNAVAHNDVIFDTRFARSSVDSTLSKLLVAETGIRNVDFKSITDYVILVVYLLKCFGVPKTEMKRFLADVQLIMEDFRSNVPHTISAKAIPTDTRGKMNDLLKFISK